MKPLPVSTIIEALAYRASLTPESLAYAFGSEQISYCQLQEDARRVARGLAERGLKPGDRCAILLPTGLDYVRAFFGAQSSGVVPLSINPELPPPFLIGRLESIGCRHAIVPQPLVESFPRHQMIEFRTVDELIHSPTAEGYSPRPDDAAFLVATSGTSGENRTAMLLHRNVIASVRSSAERLAICPDDVLVIWVPLYHSLGLNRFLLGGLYFGCPVHLVSPGLLQMRRWLETISRVRGTVTGAPDFGYRMAVELVKAEGLNLQSLRYAMNSGEPIRIATIEKFESKFGVPGVIRPGYGLSEANGVTNLGVGESLRMDSSGNLTCGRAADGLTLEIVDERGLPQPPETLGEIRLKGQQVFAGYCDDEAATREKLRDGWFYTGDIGKLDADGFLFVQGRKRAMIKRGGAMIVPRDIEVPAEQVPGVLAAGAIGVDRSSLGIEDLILVVEIDPDHATSSEARDRIIRDTATAVIQSRGLSPNEIVIAPKGGIPRTANGKLRHEELKKLYIEGTLPKP